MDILLNITQLMSKEESRFFKMYAARSNQNEDRKDLRLFDYMRRSGEKYNERKIRKELYPEANRNVFFRLKNRLLTEIGKSIMLQHILVNERSRTIHFMVLAIHFREEQNHEIAYYFIRKAEKSAQSLGDHELLDLIYGEIIRLSYSIVKINPEEYIDKRNENRVLLNRLREIDNIIAVLTYRIKFSGNLATRNSEISDITGKVVEEFSQDPAIRQNPQFRFRIYEAISKALISEHDYVALESYLLETFGEFEKEGLFSRSNHDSKLQMLTYLINALYANGKWNDSLKYVNVLWDEMQNFNRLHHDRYLFFYFNSLANIYYETDPQKGLETLNEMAKNSVIAKVPVNMMFIHLNISVFQYVLGKSNAAIKTLVQLGLEEAFRNTDDSFRLRVGVFELMIRFELDDEETFLYRLGQIQREFGELLSKSDYEREKALLAIMQKMSEDRDFAKNEALIAQVAEFEGQYENEEQDIIEYLTWLKDRFQLH